MTLPIRPGLRSVGVALTASALALALVSCGGGGGSDAKSNASSGSPTASSVAPGSATITSFDVPASVQCGAAPSTTVNVKYATSGGKSQQLLVDGRQTPLQSASGSLDVPVHCDPIAHTVVLYVLDADKKPTTQTKYLQTEMPTP